MTRNYCEIPRGLAGIEIASIDYDTSSHLKGVELMSKRFFIVVLPIVSLFFFLGEYDAEPMDEPIVYLEGEHEFDSQRISAFNIEAKISTWQPDYLRIKEVSIKKEINGHTPAAGNVFFLVKVQVRNNKLHTRLIYGPEDLKLEVKRITYPFNDNMWKIFDGSNLLALTSELSIVCTDICPYRWHEGWVLFEIPLPSSGVIEAKLQDTFWWKDYPCLESARATCKAN
jgi:hypothetical protein